MCRPRSLELICCLHIGSARSVIERHFHQMSVVRVALDIGLAVFSKPSLDPAPPTTTHCSRMFTTMIANSSQSGKFEAGERLKVASQVQPNTRLGETSKEFE